jgi:inward rectifier potassium channel
MVYAAVMTGVIFIRFSKPKPKIVYATQPVVANHHGIPTLMIRIANGRTNVLTDATVRLYAMLTETTSEGHVFRSARALDLTRNSFPLFALTWTMMHKLDENSPLYGCSAESLVADSVRFLLTFEARDPAISAHVHDLHGYLPESIAFGMRYSDAVSWDDSGRTSADIRRVSLIEEDVPRSRSISREEALL